jgi:hypothetical protein
MSITVDGVQGIAKRVYDKSGIQNFLPKASIIQRRVGWEKGTRKVGESYRIPVTLRPPNGFTYAGSAGTSATALKAARPLRSTFARRCCGWRCPGPPRRERAPSRPSPAKSSRP